MKILLVEPDFPIPAKSRNHKNFLPIGLLKLAAYNRDVGNPVKLIRGCRTKEEIKNTRIGRWYVPDEIWITSLFTYWIPYVKDCVEYYRNVYSNHNPKIVVGGIAASLFGVKKTKELTGCDEVFIGTHMGAENVKTESLKREYDLYVPDVDFQILHTQRGCERHCPFCGTWKVEPVFLEEYTIKDKIFKKKLVFYDNNFLADKDLKHATRAEKILDELIELKKEKKIIWCESQSGFDGRILLENPHLARKIKQAGFRYPRIAWDWGYNQYPSIDKQINLLVDAGYSRKDITVFMLYNWDIPFEEMEKKRIKCFEWEVQISDCRYRPLDSTYDNYNPRKDQENTNEYYIHKDGGWSDAKIKQFRKNVRRQNICVRQGLKLYSKDFERKRVDKENIRKVNNMKTKREIREYMEKHDLHYWFPDKFTPPEKKKN